MLKALVRRTLPPSWYDQISSLRRNGRLLSFSRRSYAQEGEDIALLRAFGDKRDGFYVDVGAHHPKRLSNTYLLYRRGWHGINIDAHPGSMRRFRKQRPRDVNLEVGICETTGELQFFMFEESAIDTFSPELAQEYMERGYNLVSRQFVKTRPLASVLDEHVPPGQKVDLLSVDVEGLDMEVLRSNDWDRYAPAVLVVEDQGFDAASPDYSEVYRFLQNLGYQLAAKLLQSLIFALPGRLDGA